MLRSLCLPIRPIVVAVGLGLAITGAGRAWAAVDLPDIGDPINQVLSPQQEAAIGAQMMTRARRHLDLNRDPEIAAYLDRLGAKLAGVVSDPPPNGFTFFIVYDDRINAFAAPGGYIGIHSGLFRAADSEAQLAGVLAHEIAHVTQRHLAKALAANRRNQYKTLAAVLAGLILAGQNPQAAQAAIATGQAAEAQRRINYTRSNEYEADRIGIRILAQAGFDPAGMAGMFELLQASNGAGQGTPQFLRTHPLSSNRIAEANSRAARMQEDQRRRDSLAFHLMKRRLQALQTDQPAALARKWRANEPPSATYRAAAHTYGLALLDRRRDRPAAALNRLQPLRERAPEQLNYGLTAARAHRDAGQLDQAMAIWRELDALYPRSYPVAALGADLLTSDGGADAAVAHLTDYIRRTPQPPPIAWRRLAEAAQAQGRTVRSHEALGEYYARTDRFAQALRQFDLALDKAESGSSAAKRLEARRDQVRTLQRRRAALNPISGR